MLVISTFQIIALIFTMLHIKITSILRGFAFILMLILAIIISVQIGSVISIGEYIPPLALANISEMNSIGWKVKVVPFAVLIISAIISIVLNKIKAKKKIRKIIIISLLMSLAIPISPITSFFASLHTNYIESKDYNMSPYEMDSIKLKYKKNEVTKNSYSHALINGDRKNILVIFVEGMSSLVISKDLTPNIYKLRENGISFSNYYNHTAATFRGLRGQLTSSYQMTGGYYKDKTGIGQSNKRDIDTKFNKYDYITKLTTSLEDNGYYTYFQASNSIHAPLSLMLDTLNFNRIYGREDYKKNTGELTDKESFDLLLNNLKDAKEPFFYGIYTVGTHLGLDSPDIKYRDGKNEYLNHFHQMDYWLGDFIAKFNKTEISKNTIIILTTDHASFPTEDYRNTFNTTNKEFVDKIPLIILNHEIKAGDINAHGLNSLSLTPTILDIVGVNKLNNMFLGDSLFEENKNKNKNKNNCTSTIGDRYIKTCNEKVEIEANKETIESIKQLQYFGDR
ncbi:sulfatase-like hydrolase/transferase [Citrobacter freundii]|nr:sulfatase-like hydrolase/transferase [Citrobacter freundii]MBJ8789791.1 sulfatase-like hydrolase/transferase [Citrobacter freundii]